MKTIQSRTRLAPTSTNIKSEPQIMKNGTFALAARSFCPLEPNTDVVYKSEQLWSREDD
jgi:hypothetical protein